MRIWADPIRRRGLIAAVIASVIWHLFWCFAITVEVSPSSLRKRNPTKVFFLGPVLGDDWFELVLATRPVLSETLYRDLQEEQETLEPDMESSEKDLARDWVSVPLSGRHRSFLRGIFESGKKYPLAQYEEILSIDAVSAPFQVTGPLSQRVLFHTPDPPIAEWEISNSGGGIGQEPVFEMTVNERGDVIDVEIVVSSGDPEADSLWARYLREWQFMPAEALQEGGATKGRVRIHDPEKGRLSPLDLAR